ncbi:hypothetical protein CC78DRAFT_469449 [Lojkania enalia]|uniref:C2H2-type domain-containing protein n=1 Tax=Lojkania enalia TaxID=147567 RepID=A0A9P4N0X5_9PLEO|nr:hypothetical protein CC78DRAFT_469449 [Didymosphaeria enalia]
MIDVQDHVIIQPNTFDHRYALEDTDPLVLQSLEEAPLKEELPVPVKEEPSDHEDTKPLRKIHVTRTGGKRVKKEARTGGASKKYIKEQRLPGGGRFILELEEGISAVNENGRDVFRRVYGSPREKKYCTELVNGRICGRAFVRPEHLKRHQKTHSDERNFGCVICSRKFGRNDNYQEHYWTHVKQPGKKNGRNFKFSLEAVEEKVGDIKLIEKLRSKWRKEVEKKSAKRIARR